jgi:urease accessory protein UreF
LASPISTHTTQTIAAAIRAPMATQMDARRILFEFGCVMGSLTAAPSGR